MVPGIDSAFASQATLFGVEFLTGNAALWSEVTLPAGVSTSVSGVSSATDQALPQGPLKV